ncbi:VOC family protein [Dinoroseobacter sp. S375]|uniref:VOC family protein n=1 Tax=Dinoroseobacter sp. S375 TaxID=3415136 RepID=UPI003C7DAA1E
MDYETTDADSFGKHLTGLGVNLLVRDLPARATFLSEVFDMKVFQPTEDFAILTYRDSVFQLHSDGTYHAHPLPSLLPEAGARGGGIELRLYGCDPDEAVARASARGAVILQAPVDKPHGLREAFILDADGYAWVPSNALA